MSYSFLLKFIIIGDSGVGKSCLLLQYTDKRYRDKHEITIGVEFGAKMLRSQKNNIKLQIWDTAGQESFLAITRGYYRNAVGAIICYDISNRDSFTHIARWLDDAKANGPASLSFVLVGNKSDKQAERKVTFEQGLRFAKQNGMPFLETSAREGTNVEEIFTILAETIITKIEHETVDVKTHPGVKIGNEKFVSSREGFSVKPNEDQSNIVIGGDSPGKSKKNCCK